MAAVNRVILLGRLVRDPEVRVTASGTSCCRFTVAVDRFSKEKDQADFPSVVAWKQSADYLGNYGRKGALISVEGSIRTGSYQDRGGNTVYTTEVYADRVQLLESKKSGGSDYPTTGTPLRKDDIVADDGFDPQVVDPNNDLPF